MRIINKEEFYKLPNGTICQKYEPCIFGEPFIKESVWGTPPSDYLYIPLFGMVDSMSSGEESDILYKAEKEGTSFGMDFECTMRDGLFEDKQLYAVWEDKDIEGLVMMLRDVVKGKMVIDWV